MGRRIIAVVAAAAIVSVAAIFSIILVTRHKATTPPENPPQPGETTSRAAISFNEACKSTRHPEACEAMLSSLNEGAPPQPTYEPIEMTGYATQFTAENLKTAKTMVDNLISNPASNQNVSRAANICVELLQNAMHRMHSTVNALRRGYVDDAKAWMSGALVHQQACMSGLNKTINTNLPAIGTTVSYLGSLVNFTSDALSMIVSYDVFGNQTELWSPPKTERDGFWGRFNRSALGFKGEFPSGLAVNVTVCNRTDEECDYRTIQDAVRAAPAGGQSRFVIHIKEGVYNETVRVPIEAKNVVFLGDGMGKTIITGSRNVHQPGMTTYESATVGVIGDGFMAKDLTIENTAGSSAHQAVAFRSDSDQSFLQDCEFIGNQDTLCANSLRQYYKSCRIQGNVDFIFGFAAAVFQDCHILISPRAMSPDNNVITAHGRFDPAQSTGFVLLNCTVIGTHDYMELYKKKPENCTNYLGRPWKEYSRTVYINSTLGDLITPKGWMPWDGDFALSTLYYGEFGNTGPGSDLSGRENWTTQIPVDQVNSYSVENFIQGHEWIPVSSS
ncbi:Pectinesterase [Bertholletia excelsa]